MPTETIRVSAVLAAEPREILGAWLDSAAHSAFTGGLATIEPVAGGRFSAWDGYIQGTTVVVADDRIVQRWRTSEFPEGSPDSLLEIHVEGTDEGARITLVHSEIPEGQGERYEAGWLRWYFEPMAAYFSADRADPSDFAETGEFPAAHASDASVERERSSPPAKKKTRAPATTKKPARKAPTKKPATKKPARKAPTKKPATKKPARKAPTQKKPATKKPARKAPTQKKAPTKKKPATKKPATKKKPSRKAPTKRKPATRGRRAAAR